MEDKVFVFYDGSSDKDIKYFIYDSTANSFSSTNVLETGTFNSPISQCAFFDYQYDELDYIFLDESATPDLWWNTIILNVPTVWTTKLLKWYNGSSWVEKPLKYYNGSTWVSNPIKIKM